MMKTYLAAIALALLVLLTGVSSAGAQGLTPRQQQVVALICDACARYAVDCTLPLAIARRESGFGADIVSKTDHAADGTVLSIGVYQWHAAGLGGYRAPGFEDDWRWDVRRDVDRGVALTTSHLRGGPNYLRHWYTPAGLDTRNLPACSSAWSDESEPDRRALTNAAPQWGVAVPDGEGQGDSLQTGDGPGLPHRGGPQ